MNASQQKVNFRESASASALQAFKSTPVMWSTCSTEETNTESHAVEERPALFRKSEFFQFLEIISFVQNTEEIRASQVFDLIAGWCLFGCSSPRIGKGVSEDINVNNLDVVLCYCYCHSNRSHCCSDCAGSSRGGCDCSKRSYFVYDFFIFVQCLLRFMQLTA